MEPATIGFQKRAAGINNVQWSFNTPGAVSNGMVLSVVDANSIPAVSDAGNVALVLLILLLQAFLYFGVVSWLSSRRMGSYRERDCGGCGRSQPQGGKVGINAPPQRHWVIALQAMLTFAVAARGRQLGHLHLRR